MLRLISSRFFIYDVGVVHFIFAAPSCCSAASKMRASVPCTIQYDQMIFDRGEKHDENSDLSGSCRFHGSDRNQDLQADIYPFLVIMLICLHVDLLLIRENLNGSANKACYTMVVFDRAPQVQL